jgi:beta-glucosidase
MRLRHLQHVPSSIVPSSFVAALVAALLVLPTIGCGHPAIPGGTGAGTAGNGSGTAGSSVTGVGSGNAGSSGGDTTGAAGNGGNAGSTGSAGTGVVILPLPDAGTDGAPMPVMKVACMDDPNQQAALPYSSGQVISAQVKQLAMSTVQSMSLQAKAGQLRGPNTSGYQDIFRTADAGGIKGFQFRDGPRGVNYDAVKPAGSQGYSTVYPVASGRGATFDVDLENKIGEAEGDELISSGATMLLAPTVNILRNPAWGRAQESYGEDSFMLGRMGSAHVTGVQEFAPACVKHYAANNIERNRANLNAAMDEATLQEVYARHFGMIIQDGGVACVMAAYNLVNGTKCTQDAHLMNDILRGEFGFQGMVLSDWWAMPGGQSPSQNDKLANATGAINAGLDMELPWNLNYSVLENIPNGEAAITQSALRVIETKVRFKVNAMTGALGLKVPTTTLNQSSFSVTNNAAHIALSQQAALEGAVLLKNDGNVLPIPSTAHTVAVVGPTVNWTLKGVGSNGTINFATDARIGDLGSSRVNNDPSKTVGPFAGIKAAAPAGVNVVNANGDNAATMAAAMAADFVVVVAGLTPQDEGEEYTITPDDADRDASLALDGKTGGTAQNSFISKIAALGKPMVVILEGGAAIDVRPWIASVKALVMAWYPGQAGGTALGQLVFGKANFSGKLPVTWPASLADLPTFSGGNGTTQMGYDLGYRYFDTTGKTPQFPYGAGLSYTSFAYSNVQVPCSTATAKSVVNVTVDIRNTGAMDGDETAMLFVSYPDSKDPNRTAMNYKELKGFVRVHIAAGQGARVTIPLRVSDLTHYDATSKALKVESGTVKVMVGPNASNDKLVSDATTSFMVQ